MPLTCAVVPTLTVAKFDAVKVATKFERFVLYGTVAVIFNPEIVAVTTGLSPLKLKAVIAFKLLFEFVIVNVILEASLLQALIV